MEVLEFAVSLPPAILREWDEPTDTNPSRQDLGLADRGIVGTITLFKKAAMIWFGWGRVIPDNEGGREQASDRSDDGRSDFTLGECMYWSENGSSG